MINWFQKSIVICLATALIICSYAFSYTVSADTPVQTYITIEEGCTNMGISTTNKAYTIYISDSSSDIRMISYYDNNEISLNIYVNHHIRFISLNPFKYKVQSSSNGNYSCALSATTNASYDSTYHYYYYDDYFGFYINPSDNQHQPYDYLGESVDKNMTGWTYADKKAWFYNASFGNDAVGPTPTPPPVNWGDLKNVGFYTQFVNAQSSNSGQNLDVIKWNGFEDTNKNSLLPIDCVVDIRARKIKYEGTSFSDLLTKTFSDIILTSDYIEIASINASHGEYQILWKEVYSQYDDMTPYSIIETPASLFYIQGWYYQIRLRVDDDNYTSPWKTIYTMTSMQPSSQNGMGNNDEFSQEAVKYINEVTNINTQMDTTTNYNFYYNEVPVTSPDSYNDTIDGKPWYVYLLEAITDLVSKIAEIVGSVINQFVDSLFDFASTLGVNLIDFFTNIFDNLRIGFSDISLELPMWEIDFDFEDTANQTIINLPAYIISKMFSSGIGYMVLIPLVLFLVRMFF